MAFDGSDPQDTAKARDLANYILLISEYAPAGGGKHHHGVKLLRLVSSVRRLMGAAA